MKDAFILGAGFSCSIGPEMPTTNGLAEHVVNELANDRRFAHLVSDGSLPDPDLERWLSRLAERHPFDDIVTHQFDQATFHRISGIIARAVRAAEAQVLSGPGPLPWLENLVSAWDAKRSVVCTFNYDTLVEVTFKARFTGGPGAHLLLGPGGTLFRDRTNWPRADDSFSLCKLHGSINWFWLPEGVDRSIIDIGVEEQWSQFGPPWMDPDVIASRAQTREAFIVPPTSLKGPFFGHDTLRMHWSTAHAALERADRLFIIGYSFPQTDLIGSALIGPALVGRRVTVVNRFPGDVVDRIQSLAGGSADVHVVEGDDAVAEFATAYVAEGDAVLKPTA